LLSERLQKQKAEMESQQQRLLAQAREMEEPRAQAINQQNVVANKMAALGSYTISNERLGVKFGTTLSGYIAGDASVTEYASEEIATAVNSNLNRTGKESDSMYPSVFVEIGDADHRATINGVRLSLKDVKDLLLAIGGRGVMLDFTGYSGAAPQWLIEQILTPTGYTGKTPKLPIE